METIETSKEVQELVSNMIDFAKNQLSLAFAKFGFFDQNDIARIIWSVAKTYNIEIESATNILKIAVYRF